MKYKLAPCLVVQVSNSALMANVVLKMASSFLSLPAKLPRNYAQKTVYPLFFAPLMIWLVPNVFINFSSLSLTSGRG